MPELRAARAPLAWLLAILVFFGGPAAAQVGPPIRLLPPPPQPAAGPSLPDQPPLAPPTLPEARSAPAGDGIQATPLAPIDAAWIGTLDESSRPLPQGMWQGTPRLLIAAALPLIGPTTSPTLFDLARRLLLSNAAAPRGQDPAGGPGLAALRLQRLYALGELDGAGAILDALPSNQHDDEIDRIRVELTFAKGDAAGACRNVEQGIARYQGTWWDRALIACQALAGDHAKASLGLNLLREQKVPRDATFDALVEAVGGHGGKLDRLPEPTPITATLLAAAKLPFPADALAAADPATLLTWVNSAAVSPTLRLAAAERAAALSALSPRQLTDFYAKIEFKPEEIGVAIKQRKPLATPRDRALMWAVARTDSAATTRAAVLQALLADARKREVFVIVARAVMPVLAELTPSEELQDFAPDAVRALYAANRLDLVPSWRAIVPPSAALQLSLLTRLGPENGGPGTKDGTTGADRSGGAKRDATAKQTTTLLSLLDALGQPVEASDWVPLMAPPHDATIPGAALWLDQQRAAASKRIGETVLTTLILARAGDRLSSEPIVLNRVIAGLEAVGLDGDARMLSVEAALAAGI